MREAVIVSAARTPIGKAYRGAYNKTDAPTLGSYSIKEAVERAKVDPNEIESFKNSTIKFANKAANKNLLEEII